MTRYRWVLAQRAMGIPTVLCCEVARVSPQAFYGWHRQQQHAPSARQRAEAELVAQIRSIHDASGGAYGSPRVTAELQARGLRVNHKRVERLMRCNGIAGIRKRRPKRTTTGSRSIAANPPDLLCRDFGVGAPDRVWVTDITYIRTGEGWLYLAVVLDLGSRRLLGYQMSHRIDTQLAQDALTMAAHTRKGLTCGVVVHSDHGSQYLSNDYKKTLKSWGMLQSTGRVGSSADNAAAEAFFATLKREHTNQRHYPDRATARRSIYEWLTRYNTTRRHSSINQQTPDQYEHQYHTLTT